MEEIQSPSTFAAKRKDLTGFIIRYQAINSHFLIEQWISQDTQKEMNKSGSSEHN